MVGFCDMVALWTMELLRVASVLDQTIEQD